MNDYPKNILIAVGEASGDLFASQLVQELTKIAPEIKFYGMGLDLMKQSGVDLIVNANSLSIIGGLGVIVKFSNLYRAFNQMKKALYHDKPDLLLLVDYPGFNLRLAKVAKKAGVKVLYFISPKVWAWRQSRLKIIKKYVDMMAVIFPFEVALYEQWQIPVKFVGNPLLKLIPQKLPIATIQQIFTLNPKSKTIGLFPGSRLSEIRTLLPIMLAAAKILQAHDPKIQFLLAQASSITTDNLKPYLQSNPIKIQLVSGKNYHVMQACDAIITASGTATLEIALMEVPLVIIYKISYLEYQIAKRLIKIPYIGLCNILDNRKIVPELLQADATPEKISQAVEKILDDHSYRKAMISNLKNLRKSLENNEQEELSSVVMKMINYS